MRLLKIFIGFIWAILGLFVTADRAYAVFPGVNGKIVFVGNQSGTWQLYTVNGDGSGLKQITHMPSTGFELWLPAFSPDGRVLYHTDSMRRTIYQFDLDLDAGAITNRRALASFAVHDGLPDGMTVDRDGRLWVAHFGGGRVTAFRPDGRVDDAIDVPAPNVTSCAFGGANGTTLFISTSRTWMTEAQLRDAPLAGSLFACEGLARGIPATAFDD